MYQKAGQIIQIRIEISDSARIAVYLRHNRGVEMRVWFIIIFICFSFGMKPVNPVFHRLSTENGLSSAYVTSILQDRNGYIWVGTSEGLNRYDGISFHTFRPEKENPNSIQGNTIEKLFEDDAGYIWIYFSSGEISYYDPGSGSFINYTKEWLGQQVRVYGKVFCFSSSVPSQTWIGTENGLLVFTHKTRSLQRLPGSNSVVYNAPVNSIYQAASRMVLLGTPSGFSLYNSLRKDFTDYPLRVDNGDSISICQLPGINCMYRDRSGYLWIGTEKVGAYRTVSPNDELIFHAIGQPDLRIHQFAETADGNFWIAHNRGASLIRGKNRSQLIIEDFFNDPIESAGESIHVRSMAKDKIGNVWFIDNRFDQGQFYFSTREQEIRQLQHIPEDPYSIGSNLITCLYIDRLNNLWLGHENYGLSYGSLNPLPFDYTFGYTTDSLSLSSNQVLDIYEDSSQNLWVATIGGLDRINKTTGKIDKRFSHTAPNKSEALSGKRIGSLSEDRMQNLWVTYYDAYPDFINLQTWEKKQYIPEPKIDLPKAIRGSDGFLWFSTPEKGIHGYNPENERAVSFIEPSPTHSDNPLSYPELYSLCIDKEGHLWTASAGKGIRSLNTRTGKYKDYYSVPTDSAELVSNYVHTLFCDKEGVLWIGTNAGLDRFDKKTEVFEHITTEDGLAGNVVQSIHEAEPGILYIGTNKGLSRLDTQTKKVTSYSTANGLLTNEFMPGAICRRASGLVVMGSNKGIVSFSPVLFTDKNTDDLSLIRIRPVPEEKTDTMTPWWRNTAFIFGSIIILFFINFLFWNNNRKRTKADITFEENISDKPSISETEATLSAAEQEFIQRATEVVLENLHNPQFDVDMFCSAMAMSRANLFRKLKATTGFSASAFTRNIRIQRAAEMLRQKEYTINEIATRVGFSDPNYFSRCFKEIYGVSPSGYE